MTMRMMGLWFLRFAVFCTMAKAIAMNPNDNHYNTLDDLHASWVRQLHPRHQGEGGSFSLWENVDINNINEKPQVNRYFHHSNNNDYERLEASVSHVWGGGIRQRFLETRKRREDENPHNNRHLFTAGNLADVVLEGCSASHVYANTDYDDNLGNADAEPICRCIQYVPTGSIVLECKLGDETCQDHVDADTQNTTTVCTDTYEYFFFSDDHGNLETKASCRFCTLNTTLEVCKLAAGVREICTVVAFNNTQADVLAEAQDDPVSCRIVEEYPILLDGVGANVNASIGNSTVECGDCQICGAGTEADPFGINHTCLDLFDDPSFGQCNRDAFAHLHNFAPLDNGGNNGVADIGGMYEQVCQTATPVELKLYGRNDVQYDNGYAALCDCEAPPADSGSQPKINCDLHYPQCFANLCTDISELFFFSSDSGDFQAKWTINWEESGDTSIWTQTEFNSETGWPEACSVIDQHPLTGMLTRCRNCQVCSTSNGFWGVQYDCFGLRTEGETCDTRFGRAVYNFEAPNPLPAPVSTENKEEDDSSPSQKDFYSNPLLWVVLVGGFAVCFAGTALAFVFSRKHHAQQRNAEAVARAEANNNDDGMTVASADDLPEDEFSTSASEQQQQGHPGEVL